MLALSYLLLFAMAWLTTALGPTKDILLYPNT